MSRPFQFKQFTIHQEHCAMKVGTDGVLLGAWTDVSNCQRILDIGTGSGLVALMMAQRSFATIDAIDIDSSACYQAEENFKHSPWSNRLHCIQRSIFEFNPNELYDLIVCNPPFFIHSTTTPNPSRTTARHCDIDFHQNLIIKAKNLLTDHGKLDLILPVEQGSDLISYAIQHGFYIKRVTYILPNPDKPAKRILISLTMRDTMTVKDELIIELSRHQYSQEYQALTKEFYLKM